MQRFVELDEFYLPPHLCSASTPLADAVILYRMKISIFFGASRAEPWILRTAPNPHALCGAIYVPDVANALMHSNGE